MPNPNSGCLPKFLRFLGLRSQPQAAAPAPVTPEGLPYRQRDDFLSPAEASFYRVLKSVAGDHLLICPKVSLDDIFFVAHPERNYAYLNKINRKHVDFLLCSPDSLKPLVGIELDDASHQRPQRVERDEFVEQVFATAELPLLRFPVQAAYNPQEIIQRLGPALKSAPAAPPAARPVPVGANPPLCPKCGRPMVIRVAQRGQRAGQSFYGCPNFPRCREVTPIDPIP